MLFRYQCIGKSSVTIFSTDVRVAISCYKPNLKVLVKGSFSGRGELFGFCEHLFAKIIGVAISCYKPNLKVLVKGSFSSRGELFGFCEHFFAKIIGVALSFQSLNSLGTKSSNTVQYFNPRTTNLLTQGGGRGHLDLT